MKKIVFTAIMILGLIGCSENKPMVKEGVSPSIPSKHITLLGTYTWDVESGKLGGSDNKVDFWLDKIDAVTTNLIPKNGATVEVTKKSFASLDKAYLQQFPIFRDGKICNSDIKVGTVAMFKTAEGRYGKLRIVGFKSSHDFDFKEAKKYLDDSYKKYSLRHPINKEYNLVIEYVLL